VPFGFEGDFEGAFADFALFLAFGYAFVERYFGVFGP
jgi:hypothetical protein